MDTNTNALCHQIVDTSVADWREKDVIVDDIMVVFMLFNSNNNSYDAIKLLNIFKFLI